MDAKTRIARKVGAQRVAQHAEAQRAKGLVRVAVWVPASEKDQLIAYAASLRARADLLLPSDRRLAAILRYGAAPQPPESKTSPPGRTKQSPATRDKKPRRKRRGRRKKPKQRSSGS